MENRSQNLKKPQSESRLSKPFALLKTFSEKELLSFERLVKSDYLTLSDEPYLLLKSLIKKVLPFSDKFTFEYQSIVFKEVFKKEKVQDDLKDRQKKKLNKAMNDLLNAAEKFLMFEKIKKTDEHNASLLFPELIDRKQVKLYNARIKAVEKKLDEVTKLSVEYYTKCYHIQGEKAKLSILNNTLNKNDNYDVFQYYLDVKYILEKLNFHIAKISALNVFANKNFDFSPFKALKKLFNLPQYTANPLIRLSLLNIDLIENENDITFKALLNQMSDKVNIILISHLRIFYTNLANYCIRQEAKGRIKFAFYLFEIFDHMHENNLFIVDGYINLRVLKNIITIACRVEKFDWAKAKLDYYKGYLPRSIRNDVHKYNNSIIVFNQQKYTDALELLTDVRKINDNYDLGLRMIQLQCFYETDLYYEVNTLQLVNSLRAFVNQHKKLINKQKKAYLNFIFIFKKLYKFRNILNKHSIKNAINNALPKIKERLIKYEIIREKKWLLSKIEILENL